MSLGLALPLSFGAVPAKKKILLASMSQPYLWLRQFLAQALPGLEHLPAGGAGEAFARAWFARLLARFSERGLTTPAQQKNRVVDVRNAIRARFGDDHPALAFVGFDEQTWQAINLPTHDRTEARNENQRLLRDPEGIVARAATLLESARFEDLAVGLGVTIGRRISELLDGHARLEPATAWSVTFTGQRKHRGNREDFAFEIPTLAPAADVLEAWERLQVMLGDQVLDPQTINNRYGHQVNQAAKRHFHGRVPTRLPQAAASNGEEDQTNDPLARARRGDALYLHLFRAVYATIAVHWFCPPRVNRLVYKAEIQGHRQILDAPNATMRRSYAASRHYDDYQIADAGGENIDGRQGIKLGVLPGLEVLRVFQPSCPPPELPAPAASPSPPDNTFVFPSPLAATTDAMDPANIPAATNELPPALPVTPTESSAIEAETPATPKAKKPRPGTYRIHAADRPRLDAFRADPKQSQADNLQGVITRAEEATQAMQSHQQVLEDLQAAQERAEEAKQARAQAHQEAETLRERCTAQGTEIQQLQQTLTQERTQATAATAPAGAAGSPLATAILARELLALATGSECPPALQARLIGLATQALGGSAAPGSPPVVPVGAATRRSTQAPVNPARYGPLFATGGQALHATVAADGTATTPREPASGARTPPPGDTEAVELSVAPGNGPDQAADGTKESSGASQTPAAFPDAPQVDRRRGGAADKLARAFRAVLDHNQAQSARERKWALTETAIARLTGCFRPAVRRFFNEHAAEIEAHNLTHHLTGGHNAARGKRGETIEGEIAWRGTPEPAVPAADHTAANA